MSAMTEFKFHTNAVRVFPTDDNLSFVVVASDVASALGYGKTADFLRIIPERHKGAQKVRTLGGWQEMAVLDEPGLYYGALRSNKPEAESFVEWVCGDVLPSIRRTGSYTHPSVLVLAQEVGSLRDLLGVRDQIIAAKDVAIDKLKDKVIDTQGTALRALKRVGTLERRKATLEKREALRTRNEMIARMEMAGVSRAEIARAAGQSQATLRKTIHDLRKAGLIGDIYSQQGELL